jgi:FkbM family methyltransferase
MHNPYRLIEGRHGHFLVNPNDFYIGRGLIEYGEYAEAEWQVLDQLIQLDKDVIEVGANIGAHSVSIAKKLEPQGRRLMAIEPQPIIFQNLCANLALNGLFNVHTANVAISNTPGALNFLMPNYRQSGSNFGGVAMYESGAAPHGSITQTVSANRLDDLVPEGFDVGLIKIDVEGFELKVLKSAVKTIARYRPVLYLENDRPELSPALIEWLFGVGYKIWWHQFFLFNPENYRGKTENLFSHDNKHTVNVNMLALPIESAVEIQGFPPVVSSREHPFG